MSARAREVQARLVDDLYAPALAAGEIIAMGMADLLARTAADPKRAAESVRILRDAAERALVIADTLYAAAARIVAADACQKKSSGCG